MKHLLCLLTMLSAIIAEPIEWKKLNFKQKLTAIQIYYIAKPYGLENTMIAIAWQESRLGLVPINLSDPSCGVFHITAKTYLYQNGIRDTLHNRNVACTALINSVRLSTENAIKYFLTMKKHFNGNHEKAIRAYNAGYNINTRTARDYLRLIREYENNTKKMFEKNAFFL